MPTMKLTRRTLATIQPAEKPVTFWDAEVSGLGLAVRPSGARSWLVRYRAGAGGRTGTLRQLVIGDPESMTPEAARAAAKEMLAKVRLGADPAAARAEERAADTMPNWRANGSRGMWSPSARSQPPRSIGRCWIRTFCPLLAPARPFA